MLQDFFREKKLGVYKHNQSLGDSRSFATLPAYTVFKLNENKLEKNTLTKRRLIVFARKGISRNAFELAIAAISEAVRVNILKPSEWEFFGVGALDSQSICYLDNRKDLCIRMIQNVPEREYKRILTDGHIGLSLTLSPNPSFSVFDFAAAGMIVVTNSFETRTQETFDKISKNFIVVKPSLNGIVEGISKAILNINNKKKLNQDLKLNLPTSWNDERCYGSALFDKVKLWFQNLPLPS